MAMDILERTPVVIYQCEWKTALQKNENFT